MFGAQQRGERHGMPAGRIGHAELGTGDAVLMLCDAFPEEGAVGPQTDGEVKPLDLRAGGRRRRDRGRAVDRGAQLTRPVVDDPYGRVGVILDRSGTAGWS